MSFVSLFTRLIIPVKDRILLVWEEIMEYAGISLIVWYLLMIK